MRPPRQKSRMCQAYFTKKRPNVECCAQVCDKSAKSPRALYSPKSDLRTRAELRLAGVMIWEVGQDCRLEPVTHGATTHVRTCPADDSSLLRAIDRCVCACLLDCSSQQRVSACLLRLPACQSACLSVCLSLSLCAVCLPPPSSQPPSRPRRHVSFSLTLTRRCGRLLFFL